MSDRIELMKQWDAGKYRTVTELAEAARVSRPTMYKWITRWRAEGEQGMGELSRAPLNPIRTDPAKIEQLLALKAEYPDHGPEKLVEMLADREGRRPMAPSTAGRILASYGMVKKRLQRTRVGPPSSAPRIDILAAGHTLTADHKGYFLLGDGRHCYPMTVADPVSRYVYAIDAQRRPTIDAAWKVFERIFSEFGVPDQILTDNGTPFCSARSLGGITELSKRWLKLAIHVARIAPGRPQQNGVHERMHRTLKQTATRPPQANMLEQQQHFDRFRYDYNWLRPHKSLGLRPPAERLAPFRRSYPGRLPRELDYPLHFERRRVRDTGELKIGGHRLFLSEVLAREVVGIEVLDERRADVYFGTCYLGWVDLHTGRVIKDDRTE